MKNTHRLLFFFLFITPIFSQTKVSGLVVDKNKQPIPYVNIVFKGDNKGVITNEKGVFYIESNKTYQSILVSSIGFLDKEINLSGATNYNFKIVLEEAQTLKEVVLYRGKTAKKNNPALDILKKIWEHKRKNGLKVFNQYAMQKYEKVEFDINTIDSAMMKSKIFKGMEFIFKNIDTSNVTGKSFLPVYINENLYNVYGDNKLNETKEVLYASKASGLNGNQKVLMFIKDLYSDFDIYNNYIDLFDKSFTSPLSKTGIDTYNYVLKDSAIIDKKKCYNIVYYPRRKNELTFKGDFWVSDTTFAIKKINLAVSKSANINWVKDIYLEQDFEVVNDSIFLLTRDYIMSDFVFNKSEKSRGAYGKRTTLYRDYEFNKQKPATFYKEPLNYIDNSVYNHTEEFWNQSRFEKLNKNEIGVYKMLDTLQTVKKYRDMYNTISVIVNDYVEFEKNHFDYGPLTSTFGYNVVEGLRLRVGGRTYFGPNDLWRLQGYTAYGFKDANFKYGLSGKWMIDKANRLIISGGIREDIEQIGANLTPTNDVLGRSRVSSAIFTTSTNGKLTHIKLSKLAIEIEPVKNLTFQTDFTIRKLESASPVFSLNYYTQLPTEENPKGVVKGSLKQAELGFQVELTPNRKTVKYGVERSLTTAPYTRLYINFTHGFKNVLDSDFQYNRVQLHYKQPINLTIWGRSTLIAEVGQTFGTVPLGLMGIIPGNQTYFVSENTFTNLNYYEFVSDKYATLNWQHNFNGVLFARVPILRKQNWRELLGIKAVYGTVSEANKAINASGITYNAPEKIYWEYSAGIGNIAKLFRFECTWRGNYRNLPETSNFTIKAGFGIYF